jgi:hypothetical protein
LADARSAREAAALAKSNGTDPSAAKANPQASNFEELARRWHSQQKGRWSESHARQVIPSLENGVFTKLGKKAVATIRDPDVLNVLEAKRGAVDQAHRMRQRLSDILDVAIAASLATDNPAEMVRKALPPVIKRNYPAITTIKQARALLIADANLNGYALTKLIPRFMAFTAVRSEPIRYAEPSEFEHLNRSGASLRPR